MQPWVTPALITGSAVLVTQLVLFLGWLYRTKREADVHRVFIRDIAVNHLPHLYSALKDLAHAQGIELSDPPPVQFIRFDGNGKEK